MRRAAGPQGEFWEAWNEFTAGPQGVFWEL